MSNDFFAYYILLSYSSISYSNSNSTIFSELLPRIYPSLFWWNSIYLTGNPNLDMIWRVLVCRLAKWLGKNGKVLIGRDSQYSVEINKTPVLVIDHFLTANPTNLVSTLKKKQILNLHSCL
jgi:hypothetical protein